MRTTPKSFSHFFWPFHPKIRQKKFFCKKEKKKSCEILVVKIVFLWNLCREKCVFVKSLSWKKSFVKQLFHTLFLWNTCLWKLCFCEITVVNNVFDLQIFHTDFTSISHSYNFFVTHFSHRRHFSQTRFSRVK